MEISDKHHTDDIDSYIKEREKQEKRKKRFSITPVLLSVLTLTGIAGMVWYAYTQGVKSGSENFAPIVSNNQKIKIAATNPGGEIFDNQDKQIYNHIDKNTTTNISDASLSSSKDNVKDINNDTRGTSALKPKEKPPTLLAEEQNINAPPKPTSASVQKIFTDSNNNSPNGTASAVTSPSSLALLSLANIAKKTNTPTVKKREIAKNTSETLAKPLEKTAKKDLSQKSESERQVIQQAQANNQDGWRVQIAAARSLQSARGEWARRSKQFPEFFNDYELFIDRIKKNDGSEWFRVQIAGFGNREKAQQHCNSLKTVKISCFIVRP